MSDKILLLAFLSQIAYAKCFCYHSSGCAFLTTKTSQHTSTQKVVKAFVPLPISQRNGLMAKNDNAIDVEFSFNDNEEQPSKQKPKVTKPPKTSKNEEKSLLQATLDMMDPQFASLSMEYVDPDSSSGRYIECNTAFVLEMDGVNYSIGTPCESQVAILCEGDTNSEGGGAQNYFLDPDEDINLELFEMAAARFNDEFGSQLGDGREVIFKRTPRTLTVTGDLSLITGDWKKEKEDEERKSTKPIMDDLSSTILKELGKDSSDEEEDEEDDAFFDNFMKEELGEKYREEFLVPNEEIDRQAEELMEVFKVPGFGTERGDEEGIRDMVKDAFNGKDAKKAMINENAEAIGRDGKAIEAAVRLVGFAGPDGRAYSLVQMIQPMVLVAKEDNRLLEPDQRMLLPPEEAEEIIPRLETEFRQQFKDSGLTP